MDGVKFDHNIVTANATYGTRVYHTATTGQPVNLNNNIYYNNPDGDFTSDNSTNISDPNPIKTDPKLGSNFMSATRPDIGITSPLFSATAFTGAQLAALGTAGGDAPAGGNSGGATTSTGTTGSGATGAGLTGVDAAAGLGGAVGAGGSPTGGGVIGTGFSGCTNTGKTYYVATNGDDSGPGSQSSPFKTIQKGADVVQPGETVCVLPGTYNENNKRGDLGGIWVRKDGTASNRIRFVSQQKWGAKVVSSGATGAIWRNDGAYVDIEGFEFDGAASKRAAPAIYIHGAYTRALYNHIHDISVDRCGGGVGINSGGYDTNFGTEIIGNLIHGNWRHDVAGCPGSGPISGYGIYFASPNGKVMNNVIYKNGSVGIHLWHAPYGTVVSHNLVFENGNTGIVFGCNDKPYVQCHNITISNNIVMNHGIYALREYGNNDRSNLVANNITFGGGKISMQTGTAKNNKEGVNPNIPGLSSGDYRLGAGSPAIDAATEECVSAAKVCVPPEDYYRGKRPFGNGYDIGPHEYGSTPGTATPLIPPVGGIGGLPTGPIFRGPNGDVCPSGY